MLRHVVAGLIATALAAGALRSAGRETGSATALWRGMLAFADRSFHAALPNQRGDHDHKDLLRPPVAWRIRGRGCGARIGVCPDRRLPRGGLQARRCRERAELLELHARRLAQHPGQRRRRKQLFQPRVHQPRRARLHAARLSGRLRRRPRRPPAGSAASRDAVHRPVTVTVRSGATVHAILRIVDAGNYPSSTCAQTTAAGLRVYPPGQTASKLVPYPFAACSRSGPTYLQVEAVQPGLLGDELSHSARPESRSVLGSLGAREHAWLRKALQRRARIGGARSNCRAHPRGRGGVFWRRRHGRGGRRKLCGCIGMRCASGQNKRQENAESPLHDLLRLRLDHAHAAMIADAPAHASGKISPNLV